MAWSTPVPLKVAVELAGLVKGAKFCSKIVPVVAIHLLTARLREDDRVNPRRVDGKRRPVAKPQFLQSLEETAIDENPMIAEIEQMLRSSDRASGAEKRQGRCHEGALYSGGQNRDD